MGRTDRHHLHLMWLLIQGIAAMGNLQAQDLNDEVPIAVGGRVLQIPSPEGYNRSDGVDSKWDEISEAFTSPANRLLAIFATEADHAILANGGRPELRRLFHVQVAESVEYDDMTPELFAEEKSKIKEEILSLKQSEEDLIAEQVTEGVTRIADTAGGNLPLTANKTNIADFFGETETTIGFTLISKVSTEANDESIVTAARMAIVDERVLVFYAVSQNESSSDIEWAKKAVTDWSDQAMATNSTIEEEGQESSTVSLGPARIASIAALLGGLTIWLIVAKNRRNRNTKTPR